MEGNSQVVVKQKKSHIGLVVVLVLIAGILIGVGGCYYYFEVMNNTNSNESSSESNKSTSDEIKNLDIYDSLVQSNFNKFMSIIDCSDPGANYFKSEKVEASSIDNLTAVKIIERQIFKNTNDISNEDYENIVKSYFGKDYKFSAPEEMSNHCLSHQYDSSSNTYKYHETACGCTYGPNAHMMYRVSKAELDGDKIILNVRVLFPSTSGELDSNGHVKYFSDIEHKNVISDLVYSYVSNSDGGEEKNAEVPYDNDDNFSKGGLYKFVMKKYDGDKYSFVSSEPIK